MKAQKISKAYAKAIYEIAKDNKLSLVKELTDFTELINKSSNLENVLFLDLFTNSEKQEVLEGIFSKVKFSNETTSFIKFLLQEKRLNFFPTIFKELIVIEDEAKGFLKGTVEGSEANIDQKLLSDLQALLEKKLGFSPKLEYKRNDRITAGFRATVQDLQVDATVDKQLDQLKNNFLTI